MAFFLRFRSTWFFKNFLILSAAWGLQACTTATEPGEWLIGEYGSLTGSESSFGVSTHQGIAMAIERANAAGGFRGKKFRVITYDNQGKSDESVTAVTKLITRDHVLLVIGEVASSRSIAAGAVAQQYQVPMISPSSTNPRVTQLGEYVFRVCFTDPMQGRVMAEFAFNQLKAKKVAVLRDIRSDYSMGLSDYFSKAFRELGGQIVLDVAYSSGDIDFKSQLTGIRAMRPDAVFVPGYYTEVGLIARQARELNLTVPLLGGDGWDSERLVEIGGSAIVGSYFSNHYSPSDPNPTVQTFVHDYKAKYGEKPDSMAVLGYEAALVAVHAVQTAKDASPAHLRDAIAATRSLPGVTGPITLNKNRDAEKTAVVLQVAGKDGFAYVPPEVSQERRTGGLTSFLQNLVNGLALGGVYALVALGYTMVYGILQFINFAHSEIFMLGAFTSFFLAGSLSQVSGGIGLLALLMSVSMAACMGIGFAIERLAYRPLRAAPRLNVLITAVGISLLLQNAAQIAFGATPHVFPSVVPVQSFHPWAGSELVVTNIQWIVIAVSAGLVLALTALVQRTKIGMAMRAVSFDIDVASLMGIPTDRVIVFTFLVGSALAGCASVLYGISYPKVEPMMGVGIGMKAFIAAVLGGIGSLSGAAVGGLVLGLAESFTVFYVSSSLRDAIAFAVLIAVLLLRPNGLFGITRKEKV